MNLREYLDEYINSQAYGTNTQACHCQTSNKLVCFLGDEKQIQDVTSSDARRFAADLKTMAVSSRSRHLRRCKQYFRQAVHDGLIQRNPFQGIRAKDTTNHERMRFVGMDDFERVWDAAERPLRPMLALSRLGALRVPSEGLDLQWSAVGPDTIQVIAHKTSSRWVPYFPELRERLEPFRQPEGPVVTTDIDFDYWLKKAISRAGLKVWPRLWHNLRSSRITELSDQFPIQVVTAWCGHSPAIALKHYLQKPDHYLKLAIKGVNHASPHP